MFVLSVYVMFAKTMFVQGGQARQRPLQVAVYDQMLTRALPARAATREARPASQRLLRRSSASSSLYRLYASKAPKSCAIRFEAYAKAGREMVLTDAVDQRHPCDSVDARLVRELQKPQLA